MLQAKLEELHPKMLDSLKHPIFGGGVRLNCHNGKNDFLATLRDKGSQELRAKCVVFLNSISNIFLLISLRMGAASFKAE